MMDEHSSQEETDRMEREMLEMGGGADDDFGPEVELPPDGVAMIDDDPED